MCRLLVIKSETEFAMKPHLETFARLCRKSKEYQGHGWGAVYLDKNKPVIYKHLDPIWGHDFRGFGATRFLMVHARSAFQDRDIAIENNMPFIDADIDADTDTDPDFRYGFMFNGELRGVRIKADGRIGAEKIFNFIKRMNKGSMTDAFKKAVTLIPKRTAYIRAMNIIMADIKTRAVYLCSLFNREPDYFTMHIKRRDSGFIICSEKYPGETGWAALPNHHIEVLT
jgi:glutamine amidotransferase